MAQFDVYCNDRPSRDKIPYLLDVQCDTANLATRLVIPLVDADAFGPVITRLNPIVHVRGKQVVVSTADMAGIPGASPGATVTNLCVERDRVIAASTGS